jgi:hypothetical protein
VICEGHETRARGFAARVVWRRYSLPHRAGTAGDQPRARARRATSRTRRSRARSAPRVRQPGRDVDAAADDAAGACHGVRAARRQARPREARRSAELAARQHRAPRRVLGLVRVGRWLDRHQPPLRAERAAGELDAGEQPRREGVPREVADRRVARRPGGAGLRRAGVHRCQRQDPRRPRGDQGSGGAQGGAGEAGQASPRGVRERTTVDPLQRGVVLPRRHVRVDRGARDPRRPAGLRAGALRRELRRRGRQLAVAAPHRRLLVLSRVRRQGRQARGALRRQRAVQAGASPAGLGSRRRGARLRDDRGLPRTHHAHQDRARGQARRRVGVPELHRVREAALRDRGGQPQVARPDRDQGRRDEAGRPERAREDHRRARGTDQGRAAAAQVLARRGGEGVGRGARSRGAQGGDREAREVAARRAAHGARGLQVAARRSARRGSSMPPCR